MKCIHKQIDVTNEYNFAISILCNFGLLLKHVYMTFLKNASGRNRKLIYMICRYISQKCLFLQYTYFPNLFRSNDDLFCKVLVNRRPSH